MGGGTQRIYLPLPCSKLACLHQALVAGGGIAFFGVVKIADTPLCLL